MFGSPNYSYGYNWMPSMSQTLPQTQQNQQMQTGSNIAWCQGEAGAKSYTVGAGQTMWLLDSENDGVFYIKTVDASGMPMPLRIFDFKERQAVAKTATTTSDFVTHEELEKRLAEIVNAKPTIPTA